VSAYSEFLQYVYKLHPGPMRDPKELAAWKWQACGADPKEFNSWWDRYCSERYWGGYAPSARDSAYFDRNLGSNQLYADVTGSSLKTAKSDGYGSHSDEIHETFNSTKQVQSPSVTFDKLWKSYPWGNPYDNNAYPDQCAIRMSVALQNAGINMTSFSQKLVKPLDGQKTIGRIMLNGKSTATRANELGEWLKLHPIPGIGKPENITGKDWENKVEGRTGIIMFDGYWTRTGETAADASGGHIDLWNGSRLTISSVPDALATYAREAGRNSFRQGAHTLNR